MVRARNTDGLAPLTGSVFVHISLTMLPFVALFVIHNSLVIPACCYATAIYPIYWPLPGS